MNSIVCRLVEDNSEKPKSKESGTKKKEERTLREMKTKTKLKKKY